MTNLIPISSRLFHGKPTQSVDAETFWTYLSISSPYHKWISRRISEYGFVQGEDYLTETRKTAGRPKTRYLLTLDMAKEIAMVERNEKGKQARRYFIECERRLKEPKQLTLAEPTLSPSIQKVFDEKLALYTGRAHIQIRSKLMDLAQEANRRADGAERLKEWAGAAKHMFVSGSELRIFKAESTLLLQDLNKFNDRLKDLDV